MKYEDLKFMSIGSNCADLWYLGSNRIHGPLDNIVIKSCEGVLDALEDKIFNKIYTETPVILEKNWTHSDDLNVILDYKDFKIVHNNPQTDKFKEEFTNRLLKLKEFIKEDIKDNSNWLVFNLNSYFVTDDHKPTQELLKLIEILKEKNLLNKTLFIQLFKYDVEMEDKWKAWINSEESAKLNINIINIVDVLNVKEAQIQFRNQVITLLQEKGYD